MSRKLRGNLVASGVYTAIVLFIALCAVTSRRGPFDYVLDYVNAATPTPTPPATVTVWPTVAGSSGCPVAPCPGLNPNSSRADITGLTAHVATMSAPLTVVTNFENIVHPGGPCGIDYWNPATNVHKWWGVSSGFTAGLDVNLSGPTVTGPAGIIFNGTTAPLPTFQPGGVWASVKTGATPLYVHFKGSNNFRRYFVGTTTSINGVAVDQSTGLIYFSEEALGTINQL